MEFGKSFRLGDIQASGQTWIAAIEYYLHAIGLSRILGILRKYISVVFRRIF